MMEATTDQVEFYLVLQAIALPDRLNVHDADIIVLHRDCQLVLATIQGHGENFLPFSCRRLPPSDKVVMVFL